MKHLTFSILMALLVLTSGAAFAQIIPPGPTQQLEPDLTNNNLPNPQSQTGTSTVAVTPQAEAVEPHSMDKGAMDGDMSLHTETVPAATEDKGTAPRPAATTDRLPDTASKLPLLGLIGLLALAGAFGVRRV